MKWNEMIAIWYSALFYRMKPQSCFTFHSPAGLFSLTRVWEAKIQRSVYWCGQALNPSKYWPYPPWLNIEHIAEPVSRHLSGSSMDTSRMWHKVACGLGHTISSYIHSQRACSYIGGSVKPMHTDRPNVNNRISETEVLTTTKNNAS